MKIKSVLLLVTLALSSFINTSCSTNRLKILKSDLANDRLALLTDVKSFNEIYDFKENAIIAITNSSQESHDFSSYLQEYVKEKEAIVYEISIATYLNTNFNLGYPNIYEYNCPGLILVENGKTRSYKTFSKNKDIFINKNKLFKYLNSNVEILNIYNFADVNYLKNTSQYYFYTNTDARLSKYIFNEDQGISYPFSVVFYDSTLDRDYKFIYNTLNNVKRNDIKTYTINLVNDKYTYDYINNSLKYEETKYSSYSQRYIFGNYHSDYNTPSINTYHNKTLLNCTIYGKEEFTDSLNTYQVTSSASKIKTILKNIEL